MKFTAALIAAFLPSTSAFAPSAQLSGRSCTSSTSLYSETVYKAIAQASPPAADAADDLEKTFEVIMEYLETQTNDEVVKSSDDE